MRRYESLLVQSLIFLIPANLAWHWHIQQAYVYGHLIDYLLPRFYLSDLPILILLILWLVRSKPRLPLAINSTILLSGALLVLLVCRSLASPQPIASLWLVCKLVELVLFTAYVISNFSRVVLFRLAFWPLSFAVVLQTFTALYQYIHQKQFIGYIFFGEPLLNSATHPATTMMPGVMRFLPYGTTPHPNVLAGFAAITLLILWQAAKYLPKKSTIIYPLIFTTGCCFVLLVFTESVSAWLGLIWGLICLEYRKLTIIRYSIIVLFLIILSSSVLLIVPSRLTGYHSINGFDFSSLTVRYKLNQSALTLIAKHPLFGVGLNRFTPSLVESNLMDTAPFLQPAHQIYLLWLTETGFIGTLLCVIILVRLFHRPKKVLSLPSLAPIVALACIGLYDHYPLTLQSGQLLLILSLSLPLMSPRHLFAPSSPVSVK